MPNLVLMLLMLFTIPYQNLLAINAFNCLISQELQSFQYSNFPIRIFISFYTYQIKYWRNTHALTACSVQGKISNQSCRQVWDSVWSGIMIWVNLYIGTEKWPWAYWNLKPVWVSYASHVNNLVDRLFRYQERSKIYSFPTQIKILNKNSKYF